MLRQRAIIISDAFPAFGPAQVADLHDLTGHHRYYGSSACNGGERIVETRRGRHRSMATLAEISNFTGMMP
jgi:hypothetical protein